MQQKRYIIDCIERGRYGRKSTSSISVTPSETRSDFIIKFESLTFRDKKDRLSWSSNVSACLTAWEQIKAFESSSETSSFTVKPSR